MGSASHYNRNARFIEEFESLLVSTELAGLHLPLVFENVYVETEEGGCDYVRMYYQFKDSTGRRLTLTCDHVLYDPEEDDGYDQVVDRVIRYTGLSRKEAVRRLVKAELIDSPNLEDESDD